MSKDSKFQSMVVDAIAKVVHDDGVLTSRTKHRNLLLQDISNDIHTIVVESNLSVEEAINEWLDVDNSSGPINEQYRRRIAESAVRRFPIVASS